MTSIVAISIAFFLSVSTQATAQSTGYTLDGKTPLCWYNPSQVSSSEFFVTCPPELELEILDKDDLSKNAKVLEDLSGKFVAVLPDQLTINGYSMSLQTVGGFHIEHANFHACRGGTFCSPFIKSTSGLLTTSSAQKGRVDAFDRSEFQQTFILPEAGLYQVIVHIQFWTNLGPNGGNTSAPYLYDAASAITLTADDGSGESSNVGVYIGILAAVLVIVGIGIGVFCYCKKKKQMNHRPLYDMDTQPQDEIYSYEEGIPPTIPFKYGKLATPGGEGNFAEERLGDLQRESLPYQAARSHYNTSPGGSRGSRPDYQGQGSQHSSHHDSHHSNSTHTASYDTSVRGSQPTGTVRSIEEVSLYDELRKDKQFRQALIDPAKIHLINVIGSGSFGEVYKAQYSSTTVAVKRMHPHLGDQEADQFVKEIMLIFGLRHPNIVQFLGTSWIAEYGLCAVLEYMEKGDLTTVLRTSSPTDLTWPKQKLAISIDCALGLAYLHGLSPPMMHRDLKSRNVLISATYTAKLTDFGLTREISTTTTMTCAGSNLWLAPELVKGEHFSEKADIFSFGVVLTELDTHQLPYHGATTSMGEHLSGIALAYQVAHHQRRPSLTPECPPKLKALALRCMDNDPTKRPSITQVLGVLRELATELAPVAAQAV